MADGAKEVALAKPATAVKKQTVVTLIFGEGIREIEVKISDDLTCLSPKKLDYAGKLAMKKYRHMVSEFQTKYRESERIKEEAAAKKQAEAEIARQKAYDEDQKKLQEKAERDELARLKTKYEVKK